MRLLSEDLDAAAQYHGHLCNGMVIGVRMARVALSALGIEDPLSYRDLIVYVEMDRCAADAVSVVTGCTLGKRRLKIVNYGKMAATFVDLGTGRAVRMATQGEKLSPDPADDVREFWSKVPDEQIFTMEEVNVDIPAVDLPGRPSRLTTCTCCGERVFDGREVSGNAGGPLCRACATTPYYSRP